MNGGANARRWLRTLRHLRTQQLLGQVRHRLLGGRAPGSWSGAPPTLSIPGPAVPFLPAPAFAWTDGALRFRLRNREVSFSGSVDWDYADAGPLWAYDLHSFEWARRPTLAAGARRGLVLDWIDRHREGTGWSPHPTSLRTVAWSKLSLTPGALGSDARTRDRVLASLGAQLDHLAANLETHLLANHYLSNLLALAFCGAILDGPAAEGWRSHQPRLIRELETQIGVDGLHQERSPMYHALLLETVLDLINVSGSRPDEAVGALRDTAARMLGALEVLVHPDGGIALFADSAFDVAQEPDVLLAYGAALGIVPQPPSRAGVLTGGGYVRLAHGSLTLIASVAGPAPSHQPGHAHCDALAFELSVGRERVITDTGVHEYIPGPLREISRATRSHATLEVGGRDQAEIWAAHRVGGRPVVRLDSVDEKRVEAHCTGWSTPDTRHVRVFEIGESGLTVEDRLEGRPRRGRLALPLAPGLEVRLEGPRARLRLASGTWVRLDLTGGPSFRVERAPYFPEFGRRIERSVLVAEADPWPGTELRITVARAAR